VRVTDKVTRVVRCDTFAEVRILLYDAVSAFARR